MSESAPPKAGITISEAQAFVKSQIEAHGLTAAPPELDGRFWFIRIKSPKGAAIGIVTISPYVIDDSKEHAQELLMQQVLEAIRAATKEPIMKALGDG